MFAKNKLPFDYQIRYSQRAKRLRIVVEPEKVEVVVPDKISSRKMQQFIYEQQNWVVAALGKMADKQEATKPLLPNKYEHGAVIPYQGEMYALRINLANTPKVVIDFQDTFIITVPKLLPKDEQSGAIKQALIQWLKGRAIIQVDQWVDIHAAKHKLRPQTVKVKVQKSRWGSCGVNNGINLNWLLILAPPEVMEYVVVHEMCHIQHRNHSADFWALVADHLPDFHTHRHWLKEHGQSLMLSEQ